LSLKQESFDFLNHFLEIIAWRKFDSYETEHD